jgi:hypothetical protein
MPLKEGSSDEVISANVQTLIGEGTPHDNAVEQAYKHAGKSRVETSLAAAAAEQSPPGHDVALRDASGFRAAAPRIVGHVGR